MMDIPPALILYISLSKQMNIAEIHMEGKWFHSGWNLMLGVCDGTSGSIEIWNFLKSH
jgi:hypothetical protein